MAFKNFDKADFTRRSLLRGGAFLAGGAALSSLPLGRVAFAQSGVTPWQGVKALVNEYVTSGKVANMVAVMGWRGGAPVIIAAGTLEMGKGAKADIDSLYRIYSMTKPITGMAAMMLIDDGKMGLDQPLAEILPAYANMQVQKEYDGSIGPENLEPAKIPITIRHLLTHTAGLGYGITQKGPIKDEYEKRGLIPGQVTRLPIPGFSRGMPVKSLAAFADGMAQLPLVYHPGKQWSYSTGLDVLGRVIEVVSGMPFDTFLSENIFKPTGMDSTWFKVPASEAARLTGNYGVMKGMSLPIDPGASSIFLDDPAFPMGGAGLVSSPRDYDRFLKMLAGYGKIEGKRVMGELAVRVGTSNLLPAGASTEGTWVAGQGFGAGGVVRGTTYGWAGAAGTMGFVDMQNNLRAAVYTQYMPSEAYDLQKKFPEIVTRDILELMTMHSK